MLVRCPSMAIHSFPFRKPASGLLAWFALAALFAQPGLGQAPAVAGPESPRITYRLSGVITDAAREPISEADVAAIESGNPSRSTVTDGRGRFDLGQFTAGQVSIRVRRLGYEQRTVAVQMGARGQQTSVELVLVPVPTELEDVEVSSRSGGRLREFYQRRQQRGTFGRFLDQDEIRRLGPLNTSDLFRTVPGIKIAANPAGGNVIRIRDCQPMVWVDAQRVPGAELDEVTLPGDIAAIEFYPSSAGVPAQYMERGNRLCGLILVWTKS